MADSAEGSISISRIVQKLQEAPPEAVPGRSEGNSGRFALLTRLLFFTVTSFDGAPHLAPSLATNVIRVTTRTAPHARELAFGACTP